jgi:hypothetical protein
LREKFFEQFAADRFVTALGQPPAALIAASDVKAKGHGRKSRRHGVIQLDAKG